MSGPTNRMAEGAVARDGLARDRQIALWPWQLPEGPGAGLLPVAVANPAIESVWLRDPVSGETRPASPHAAYDAAEVIGVDLILRVICAVKDELQRPGQVAAPRAIEGVLSGPAEAPGGLPVAIDYFDRDAVDQSDPRLIMPLSGLGLRLPSLSHLRRVRIGVDGRLESVGAVVLPETGRYEIYGKEDPSVTWLDGTPWLSYVSVSDWGVTPVLARGRWTNGGFCYERIDEAQGHHDNRDVKILPVRPGGLLWRHDRVNTLPWGPKRMTWATSPDDGRSWSGSKPLMAGRFDWEKNHVGSGAVPFPCEGPGGVRALASFYHGVYREAGAVAGVYQTGLALFDAERPDRELGRMKSPVVTAWETARFEEVRKAACALPEDIFQARHGLFVVPRVVFTTGAARIGDATWLFSGVNDFAIERAILPRLEAILAEDYAPAQEGGG